MGELAAILAMLASLVALEALILSQASSGCNNQVCYCRTHCSSVFTGFIGPKTGLGVGLGAAQMRSSRRKILEDVILSESKVRADNES